MEDKENRYGQRLFHSYAGITRIRFEGFARRLGGRRSLSPLPGLPWKGLMMRPVTAPVNLAELLFRPPSQNGRIRGTAIKEIAPARIVIGTPTLTKSMNR